MEKRKCLVSTWVRTAIRAGRGLVAVLTTLYLLLLCRTFISRLIIFELLAIRATAVVCGKVLIGTEISAGVLLPATVA